MSVLVSTPSALSAAGQGGRDIGEAAGLDERRDFGGDRQRLHTLHCDSRSIIGWVIRQTALIGASEALRVERWIFADDEPGRNPHAAVDDDIGEPGRAPYVDVWKNHRVLDARV